MKTFQRTRYTREDFIEAVANSTSIRQVLKKLGLNPTGGNYTSFQNTVKNLNLDISHFKGQSWNKGNTYEPIYSLEEVFSGKRRMTSHKLRLRLIREGYKEQRCEECGIVDWQGKSLSLHLDHINGNKYDNSLENLQILCPNCHSQTSTYAGKNHGKYSKGLARD